MLRFFHVLMPLALSALCLASCSSDDDDDAPANQSGSGGSGGSSGSSGSGGSNGSGGSAGSGGGGAKGMSFFVTSKTNSGNLGGLAGADAICKSLAEAAGAGDKGWRAYLSVEDDGTGKAVNARDRIGSGPWVNAKGATVANDVASLHARTGNADDFLDESGKKINGQWSGSPTPNEHDILTGSTAEGTVVSGATCNNWTSDSDDGTKAQLGHSDGLGPMQSAEPPRNSWQSAHASRGCSSAALNMTGGAGRFYCFATQP